MTGLFVGRLRSKWFYLQFLYYLTLALTFWVIAFELGPNVVNFRSLKRPTPADFVNQVQKECVPMVRAIKEYQRDNGGLPKDMEVLVPRYLPKELNWYDQRIVGGTFVFHGRWHQAIVYDFRPGQEGWSVHGRFVSGAIPLPPVKLAPTTQPN